MSSPARPAAADESDLSGRTLGDFRLLRRLGRGAMAEVYLAEQQKLRRQVALKVLKANLAGDATYVARFQNEAMAAAALVHANIVQIYEVGQADGYHYIAQEYVPGMNLREWLQRNGMPDAAFALTIMRQTAAALHKAAQAGIVHRDIKPENIMLSTGGEVKVADFGLARIGRDDDALHLTQIGVTMGTPLYMSPEQVEGKDLDPRSDLYSFGVSCYHMLSGSPPFQGETALAVAVQHLKTRARPLEELRPDLPVDLCRIVERLMEKLPADRYPSARDVLRDLRALPIAAAEDDAAWTRGLDEHTALELSAAGNLHSATRQLDALMKTQAVVLRKNESWLRRLLAAAAAAFVVGAGIAGVRAWLEPSLLEASAAASPEAQGAVPPRESAEAQLAAALWPGPDMEARLKAVEHYFPGETYYVQRAKQELARMYWRENRLDEALALFQEFKNMIAEEYQAFGLAGESLVYTKREQVSEAAEAIGRLQLKNYWRLLDGRMQQEMQYAVTANRKALAERNALPTTPTTTVPRQPNGEAQVNFARMQLDDKAREEALNSVRLHFPDDAESVDEARQELALLYLQQDRIRTALPVFLEFAGATDERRGLRAFGLAGEAIVFARQGDTAQACRALELLLPLQTALDPRLHRQLAQVLPDLLTKLDPKIAADWGGWLGRQKD